MTEFHLAQVNIARLSAPLDSPQLADFVANLGPINAVADASEGFVWRLQTEAGDATSLRFLDDDWLIVNMSVWESLEALRSYVYRSAACRRAAATAGVVRPHGRGARGAVVDRGRHAAHARRRAGAPHDAPGRRTDAGRVHAEGALSAQTTGSSAMIPVR